MTEHNVIMGRIYDSCSCGALWQGRTHADFIRHVDNAELQERFANQEKTRQSAIEEIMEELDR